MNEYFKQLSSLIQNESSVDRFKELYKKHFNKDAPENLIKDYQMQISNKQSYEEESSYDSYDDSYSY